MEWKIEQKNEKKVFLIALDMAIKKDIWTSIRKHANELKVYKKTKTAIKKDLSPDHNPLHYALWGVSENTNTTFDPNIGSFKTAI